MEIRKCDRCGQTRATNAPRNIEIIKKYNYEKNPFNPRSHDDHGSGNGTERKTPREHHHQEP